jgi:predicted metal-binding membrane protein
MDRGFGAIAPEGRASLVSERAFLGTRALLFLASAGVTIYACRSMSAGMSMPGGWTTSMAWMRMPGQSWLGAAAAFLGMWVVMMVAMMLPSLVPMLLRYRRGLRRSDQTRRGGRTVLAGAGYFFVWAVLGAVVYPLGVALAVAEMRWPPLSRSVPAATGVVLLLTGCVQFTAWKARQLGCCRGNMPMGERAPLSPDARSAWKHGLRLGVHCILCCSGFMAILLGTGVMDLGAMAIVAAAITFERLAPRPERIARVIGALLLAAGALAVARALSAA